MQCCLNPTHSGCQKCSHDPESVAKNVHFLKIVVIKLVCCESHIWYVPCSDKRDTGQASSRPLPGLPDTTSRWTLPESKEL